jgi:hypothetical protein
MIGRLAPIWDLSTQEPCARLRHPAKTLRRCQPVYVGVYDSVECALLARDRRQRLRCTVYAASLAGGRRTCLAHQVRTLAAGDNRTYGPYSAFIVGHLIPIRQALIGSSLY